MKLSDTASNCNVRTNWGGGGLNELCTVPEWGYHWSQHLSDYHQCNVLCSLLCSEALSKTNH